jgi:hypothetical protein
LNKLWNGGAACSEIVPISSNIRWGREVQENNKSKNFPGNNKSKNLRIVYWHSTDNQFAIR